MNMEMIIVGTFELVLFIAVVAFIICYCNKD